MLQPAPVRTPPCAVDQPNASGIAPKVASWLLMSTEHLIPGDLRELYHVREWRNAAGVLSTACPGEWDDIIEVLRALRLLRSEILTAGGGLSPTPQQVNGSILLTSNSHSEATGPAIFACMEASANSNVGKLPIRS